MIEHYLGQPVLEFELNTNLIDNINEKMDKEIEEKKIFTLLNINVK
jgi:hypothetical protein